MPAGAKMSIASMKAEPMMPNMSVTPLATRVSTKASDGVIFCTPLTTVRLLGLAAAAGLFMGRLLWAVAGWSGFRNEKFRIQERNEVDGL